MELLRLVLAVMSILMLIGSLFSEGHGKTHLLLYAILYATLFENQ